MQKKFSFENKFKFRLTVLPRIKRNTPLWADKFSIDRQFFFHFDVNIFQKMGNILEEIVC